MPQYRSRLDVCTIVRVAGDILQLALSILRPRGRLAAENLFLRKQLALYLERQVKPRRADDATRLTLVALSRLIEWRQLLTVVKTETLIRWHRKGFRLFWRWKSRPQGRPRVPVVRQNSSDVYRPDNLARSSDAGVACSRTPLKRDVSP